MHLDKELKNVIFIAIILKLVIIILILTSPYFLPFETHKAEPTGSILDSFLQYDALGYTDIAKNGYRQLSDIGTYGFFPLYPLLIKILSYVFGVYFSSILLSNIFSILAIVVIYALLKEEINKKVAYKTCFFLLLFPTSYFLSVAYTESLFLFLSCLTFLLAKKNMWFLSCIVGALSSLTRMQGVILFFPLLYMYLSSKNFEIKNIKPNILFLLFIPFAIFILQLYFYMITGNLLANVKDQTTFGRTLSLPWTGIEFFMQRLFSEPYSIIKSIYYGSTLFLTGLFIFLAVKSYKILKKEYFIYFVLSLIPPLITTTLEAITRFELVMFPAFITLAVISQNNRNFKIIKLMYLAFFFLMLGFIVWHINGGFVISGFS